MNKIEKGPAFWKAFGQEAALWAAVAVAGSLLLPGGSMTLPEEPEKMGWTVLRVCAVLPLGEELIFRGGVQRLLRPLDRKSTRLNSSHPNPSRMPSSA